MRNDTEKKERKKERKKKERKYAKERKKERKKAIPYPPRFGLNSKLLNCFSTSMSLALDNPRKFIWH